MKEKATILAPEQSPDDAQCTDEHPIKKRRIERKKPESPPWKKSLADGPSSFTVEGRRRSGRVNSIPLNLQPPSEKRSTRASHKINSTRIKGYGKEVKSTLSYPLKSSKNVLTPSNVSQRSISCTPRPKSSTRNTSPKAYNRKSSQNNLTKNSVYTNKASLAPKSSVSSDEISQSKKINKLGKDIEQSTGIRAKIRLRVKPPKLPITHPGLVLTRPSRYSDLQEYFQNEGERHINEGGLFCPETPVEYPPDSALNDALIILRAERAAEPGGILAYSKYHIFNEVEDSQKIPSQYSHRDHLCRAMAGFRKLMLIEQKSHRQQAKRIAEACVDEWFRRQPKTTEQLEAELTMDSQLRYKSVIKTLRGTWDNVAAEVNRRRLVEWEIKEQARVRKALSEAVEKSQLKLQQHKDCMNTSFSTDDEDEVEPLVNTDDGIKLQLERSNSESKISQNNSEINKDIVLIDTEEDDLLTVEQLREKYAILSCLGRDQLDNTVTYIENISNAELETKGDVNRENEIKPIYGSDESMDTDTDDDSISSNETNEISTNDEDGEDDAGETSLLGFLTKTELKTLDHCEVKSLNGLTPKKITENENQDNLLAINVEKDIFPVKVTSKTAQSEDGSHTNGIKAKPENTQNNYYPRTSGILVNQKIVSSLSDHSHKDSLLNSPTYLEQTIKVIPQNLDFEFPRTLTTANGYLFQNDSILSPESEIGNLKYIKGTKPQPDSQIKTPVPFLLRGTLREYQHYGLDWLAGLYANNTNGILADEMGLGKTIQTIALLAHLACVHEEWGPHLVIVPTSVILNWEMEFKKWCPGFKIMTYYGSIEERKKKRIGWKNKDMWNVCITSYQLIIRDQQVFKRRRWHYMILDEAHNIKNFNSQRWQTMLTFNTRARLLLTGTPLQNNLTELWSLLYFLMPSDGTNQGVGGFADLQEFQDWFKKPSEQILEHGREQMDNESWSIISKLHKILRPYLLRRLKADVEKQMPAKFEHIEFCHLSKRQRELYDGFLSRDDTKNTLAFGNNLSIINCLMQLRKVCNHPDLFIDRPILTSLPMERSVVADFEIKELLVRRRLLREDSMSKVSLEFLNLVPTKYERLSDYNTSRTAALSAQRKILDLRDAQRLRAQKDSTKYDPSTMQSNLTYLESSSRWSRFEELQHCVYVNALRRQQKPIYGSQLVELLSLELNELNPKPKRRDQLINWLGNTPSVMKDLIRPVSDRAEAFKGTIQRFACSTPAVIAKDITLFTLTSRGLAFIQDHIDSSKIDPFHEARMRLSIQFPDKRLLQYDCGKLQSLDRLLRKLQAEGHRALIFTQMTKVLDILEQFLNIHGHKYLRLDGSTKIEQRQILTDRFNNDTRILAFILSSRSGGLGINLTGADTVIFYDLDWNPAMDKQCQDRCHRIGQTRDVHIYRLISEHTIETNILRKANQKRMLDDVVIQEGDFTTDYFQKISVRDMIENESHLMGNDAAANAAVDRVLGVSDSKEVNHDFAQAEDKEDVIAARLAEREILQTDAGDFEENLPSATETTGQDTIYTPLQDITINSENFMIEADEVELNAWGNPIQPMDNYMLTFMMEQLKGSSLELPKDKIKNKRPKDNRSQRIR
ncbi:Helicase SWR1 [Erysiphe neolycopersici]|uniref:DNA helicase n=1 Tax=Erysiphe neolycopersici TaxID=212602 RepID=A0A420HS72_9PEZI|nr:Helicase SWR1 [Erysiphe neolycopersici]